MDQQVLGSCLGQPAPDHCGGNVWVPIWRERHGCTARLDSILACAWLHFLISMAQDTVTYPRRTERQLEGYRVDVHLIRSVVDSCHWWYGDGGSRVARVWCVHTDRLRRAGSMYLNFHFLIKLSSPCHKVPEPTP